MDEATARVRLARMVAADKAPSLDQDTLDDLLRQATRADAQGRLPTDTGWVPTWNLAQAAALGWEAKAALVAGDYGFTADGARFDKGRVIDSCRAMAAMYRAKAVGSIQGVTVQGTTDPNGAAALALGNWSTW